MEVSNTSLLLKKFSRYKLGLVCFWFLVVMYIIVILGGFISPYTPGTPYQGEAAQGGQARELYSYYKTKTMHPPTPIQMSSDGRLYTREMQRQERPGYNIFIPLGVEGSITNVIDIIKAQSVESIIDNFPLGEKDGIEYPTPLIELINKLSKDSKPLLLRLLNNSQTQKDWIADIIIETIDKDMRVSSVQSVVRSNFLFEEFKSTIIGYDPNLEYDDNDLKEIYNSDFSSEEGLRIADIIIRQKQGMVLDVILKKLGINGLNAQVSDAQLKIIFEEILEKVNDSEKEEIYAKSKTYKMTTSKDEGNNLVYKAGFEGNLKHFEELINAYEKLPEDVKKNPYFENDIEKYPDIIKEAIAKYLEIYVADDTLDNYFKMIKDTEYFKEFPEKEQAIFSNTYRGCEYIGYENYEDVKEGLPVVFRDIVEKSPIYIANNTKTVEEYYGEIIESSYYANIPEDVKQKFERAYNGYAYLETELYKNIRGELPEEFKTIIENSPKYLATILRGFLSNIPSYTSKIIFGDMLKDLEKDYSGALKTEYNLIKDKLLNDPKYSEIIKGIEAYRNATFTVKDMLRYIISKEDLDKLPEGDRTSVNSRDDLQNRIVNNNIYSLLPISVAELFKKYVNFSIEGTGKWRTLEEIFKIIPHTSDNHDIPTLDKIVVNKYMGLLKEELDETLLTTLDKNNKTLMDYLKVYIAEERKQYEHELAWFVKGEEYTLFWVFKNDIHLFGTKDRGTFYLLGADEQGRDILSRMIYGGTISLTVGFLGMFLSLVISIVIGGIAGYFGGWVDWVLMRICEIVLLFPAFYLLLTLRGVLPTDLTPEQRFILIIIILSFMEWAGGARVIRGFILSGKNQDFVIAAKVTGIPTWLVILKHLLPQISSYLIIRISIGIPGYIIYETSLSWLGFGITEPSVSWGLMLAILRELSIISVATDYPWLLWPSVIVIVAVMCYQLIGDAIRDTLDPMVKR